MGFTPQDLMKMIVASKIKANKPVEAGLKPEGQGQTDVFGDVNFNKTMLDRLTEIKNLMVSPEAKKSKSILFDPLNPGGFPGVGIDAGSYRDDAMEKHEQGGLDKMLMQGLRAIDPKAAEIRQKYYDLSSRAASPVSLKGGKALTSDEVATHLAGYLPDMEADKATNLQRVMDGILDFQNKVNVSSDDLSTMMGGKEEEIKKITKPRPRPILFQ